MVYASGGGCKGLWPHHVVIRGGLVFDTNVSWRGSHDIKGVLRAGGAPKNIY